MKTYRWLLAVIIIGLVGTFASQHAKGGEVPCPPKKKEGRMTGGGNFICVDSCGKEVKTTHGFELHCDVDDFPNNLEVNWAGNHFHLENYESAFCIDDPGFSPNPPPAPIDTLVFTGEGRLNGTSGAFVQAIFTDKGEPGVNDTVEMSIFDADGNLVLSCETTLEGGNHQAHRETGSDAR